MQEPSQQVGKVHFSPQSCQQQSHQFDEITIISFIIEDLRNQSAKLKNNGKGYAEASPTIE